MFEIRRYTGKDSNAWNAFVRQSKQGTFLFDRHYMDYHHDRFTDCSFMFYLKGNPYALLPANVDGDTLWSHQGLTYGGLITGAHATAAEVCTLFEELMAELRRLGIKRMIYKPVPWIYQQLPSEEDLYAIFNRCHARLLVRNVSSVIDMGNALKWRRIRQFGADKARMNGLEVTRDDNAYGSFWHVLEENLALAHHTKPVHTVNEMLRLHTSFPDNIALYVARWEGKVVGGVLLYVSTKVVHVQYISASPEGKRLHAIDSIFHKIIKEDRVDCQYFDFGTSNEDRGRFLNEGLIYQKEGFGGRAVCYDWYEIEINC